MPAVVAGAVVSAIGLTGVVATVASAAIATIGSIAIQSMVSSGKPKSRRASTGRRIDLVRSTTEPRRVIYGQARVSGPLVFAHAGNSREGGKNHILHLAIALAGHPIQDIGAIYVDEKRMEGRKASRSWYLPPNDSSYTIDPAYNGVTQTNYLQWRTHLGSEDQTYDSELYHAAPDLWTEKHRLRGVAYTVTRLQWDSTIWAGGLPNLSWEVRGRRVYDPRTGKTGWSNNPALCIRDYLLSDFGLNCGLDEIDESSFIAAANLCDERVNTAEGGEQKRYTCNGVFSMDEKPIEVVEGLLSSCAGALIYAQGKYRLYPAAYREPILSLDENILRDKITVYPRTPLQDKVNTVRGTYIEPADGWQEADFPPVTADLEADSSITLTKDLNLPFTTNTYEAQRLARLYLQRARYPLTIKMPCTMAALAVDVYEPVRLSIAQLGWKDKVFTPTGWSLSEEGGVDLILQEENQTIYSWTGGSAPNRTTPEVNLPSTTPAPPLLTSTDVMIGDAQMLRITVSSPEDAFITRTDVSYRRIYDNGANDGWRSAGSGQTLFITPILAGETYQIRARCVNVLGFTSPWTIIQHQAAGSISPPGDILTFTRYVVGSTLYLDWEPPSSGPPISSYRLRWSPLTQGASWAGAIDISTSLTNTEITLPARTGTYLLKPVDIFGREGNDAASVINASVDDRSLKNVTTSTQHPSFAGTKSNCRVTVDNKLIIDSLSAFDAQQGNVEDDPDVSFDALANAEGTEKLSIGLYTFAEIVDLGAPYTAVHLEARVKTDVLDLVDEVGSSTGSFDDREGAFDGAAPSTIDVMLYTSTTEDDPSDPAAQWSEWQILSMGDYRARAFRFRARLTSSNAMATPAVEELSVALNLQHRSESAQSILCPNNGSTVNFEHSFKGTPSIAISGHNLQSGDTHTLTGKTESGFTIHFTDASGSNVERSFDWAASGYGKAVSGT